LKPHYRLACLSNTNPLDVRRFREADTPLPQIVFSIAVRHGSNSIPLTVEQLHGLGIPLQASSLESSPRF
jgi:hypothetical protein